MLKVSVITLFPDFVSHLLNFGILSRSLETVKVDFIDLRDFGVGVRRRVDDSVVGPGSGMLMKANVFLSALQSLSNGFNRSYVVHMSPRGKVLTQERALSLSQKEHLVLVASRYEGLDQRFIDQHVDEEISIGDYILSGGELAALVVLDAVLRVSGCLKKEALEEESFKRGLLEYSQYTKPKIFDGIKIPDYLFSGDHELIREKRYMDQLLLTCINRLDLFREYSICSEDIPHSDCLTKMKKKNILLKQRLEAFEKVLREYRHGRRNC